MIKEDYVWVGIRIFGIYLLVLALIGLPSLVHSLYMSYHLRGFPSMYDYNIEDEDNVDDLSKDLHKYLNSLFLSYASNSISCVIRVVLYVLAGLYMTCKGKFLFRIVSSPLKKEDVGET